MEEEDIEKYYKVIGDHGKKKGYETHEILLFLSALFLSTIEIHGVSEKDAKELMKRRMDEFMRRPRRKKIPEEQNA